MGNYFDKLNKMYEKHCKLRLPKIEKSNLRENIMVIGFKNSGKTTLIDFLAGHIIKDNKFFNQTTNINKIEYKKFIFFDTPGLEKGECKLIKRKDKHFLKLIDKMDSIIICTNEVEQEPFLELLNFVEQKINIDTNIIVVKTRLLDLINKHKTYNLANKYVRIQIGLENDIALYSLSTIKRDLFESALNIKWGYNSEIMRNYILNSLSQTPYKPEILAKKVEKYFN